MGIERLKEPLDDSEVEWRVGQHGVGNNGQPWAKLLCYVTARAVMERLDEAVGPENWKVEHAKAPNDPKGESVVCTLSIKIGGEWVGKMDGAQNTEFEPVKGGMSDALKRAGVLWGIGRELYGLGETWAKCVTEKTTEPGWHYAKDKSGKPYWWSGPSLSAVRKVKPQKTPRPKPTAKAAAPAASEVDHRSAVLHALNEVAGCESDEQRDRCINDITGEQFTGVAELDSPADAKTIHAFLCDFRARGERLEGLAVALEVGDATGFSAATETPAELAEAKRPWSVLTFTPSGEITPEQHKEYVGAVHAALKDAGATTKAEADKILAWVSGGQFPSFAALGESSDPRRARAAFGWCVEVAKNNPVDDWRRLALAAPRTGAKPEKQKQLVGG